MVDELGRRVWVIAEGYIPGESHDANPTRAMLSHETACILNANDELAAALAGTVVASVGTIGAPGDKPERGTHWKYVITLGT